MRDSIVNIAAIVCISLIAFRFLVLLFSLVTVPYALKTEKKIKSFKKDSEGDIFPKGIYDLTEYTSFRNGIKAVAIVFIKLIECKETTTEEEYEIATSYFRKRYQHSHFISPFFKDADRMEKMLRKGEIETLNYRFYAIDILKSKMSYEARLEMMEYLFQMANLNGGVNDEQLSLLRAFAKYMLIEEWDVAQLEYQYECRKEDTDKSLYKVDDLLAYAFAILKLQPDANDHEIKESYRALVKQYHPDHLSPDLSPAEIEESIVNFRQVMDAYQLICKVKNL